MLVLCNRVLVRRSPNGTHWNGCRRVGDVTGLLGLADGAGNNHKIDALHQKRTIGLRVHIFRSDVNNWIVFEINSEPSLCFSYSSVTEGMRTLQDCDSPKGLKQTQKNFIKRAIAGFRQNSRIERYFEIPSNYLSVSLLLDLPQRRERDETPATR